MSSVDDLRYTQSMTIMMNGLPGHSAAELSSNFDINSQTSHPQFKLEFTKLDDYRHALPSSSLTYLTSAPSGSHHQPPFYTHHHHSGNQPGRLLSASALSFETVSSSAVSATNANRYELDVKMMGRSTSGSSSSPSPTASSSSSVNSSGGVSMSPRQHQQPPETSKGKFINPFFFSLNF
jgi:hypothetical protein